MMAQEAYPLLFEICPLIMRTQGILLVKDVVLIVTLCSAGGGGYLTSSLTLVDPRYVIAEAKLGQLKQICHELMSRLDEYSDALLRNMRIVLQIDDRQGAEIIQGSCVSCLAHLAVLCDLIGRLEPNSKPQVDAVCDSSLERLGRLTQEMCFDQYTCFDLLLMVRHWVDFSDAVNKTMMSLVRFRGKGHWSRSIRALVVYRVRKVHRYDFVGRSLRGRCQILKPNSQTCLVLQHSPHKWCSTMAGKRDQGIRTLCWVRRESPMGYDSDMPRRCCEMARFPRVSLQTSQSTYLY